MLQGVLVHACSAPKPNQSTQGWTSQTNDQQTLFIFVLVLFGWGFHIDTPISMKIQSVAYFNYPFLWGVCLQRRPSHLLSPSTSVFVFFFLFFYREASKTSAKKADRGYGGCCVSYISRKRWFSTLRKYFPWILFSLASMEAACICKAHASWRALAMSRIPLDSLLNVFTSQDLVRLVGLVVKTSSPRAEDHGFYQVAPWGFFPGRVISVT